MKLSKLLFFLSLAPAVLLIAGSVVSMFTGCGVFHKKVYGIEALYSFFMLNGVAMIVAVPVFPACMIYQIFYLRTFGPPFEKNSAAAEQKPDSDDLPLLIRPVIISDNKKEIISAVLFLALAAAVIGYSRLVFPEVWG